jgi:hypothetical protein
VVDEPIGNGGGHGGRIEGVPQAHRKEARYELRNCA